jgi:hypothetical protein
MQLSFHGLWLAQFGGGGGNTPLPLFWKKHWIWPLMVFYKLNLALVMYEVGHRWHGWSRGRNSSLHIFQTGSGTHATSYPMGTVGSFPGGKAAGAWRWPLTSS